MNFCFATWFQRKSVQIGLVAILVSGLSAQVSDLRPRVGVPEDWTHHRIKFSSAFLRQHPEIAAREPRAAAQLYREAFIQAQAQMGSVLPVAQTTPAEALTPHRDWSVPLGNGRLGFGQFPAKWNGDPTAAPNCDTDYVIYTITAVGSTPGQPSIVGLNNLYTAASGTVFCPNPPYPSNQPNFLFSYNTNSISNGRITTSPVLSVDGKKVAFVETTPASGTKSAVFHVLTIPPPTGPQQLTVTPASLPPAGALKSVTIAAMSDTRSSPWVDYPSDTAYVALDDGRLYKITGVFNGTPTVVMTAPWPITINLGSFLTSPVLDSTTGNIFIGARNGRLYTVNVNTPGPVTTIQVGRTSGAGSSNPGIFDSVMFDSTGATVFTVTANDNVSTRAAVVQVNATSPFAIVSRVDIGLGNSGGGNINLYDGDFDNNYFNAPATGHMLICGTGTADTTPYRYLLNFNASGILQPGSSTQISTDATARCSPVTEYFNPNISGGTDFFFWGVTKSCPTHAAGCVMALTNETTLAAAPVTGGTSGIIIDNDYVTKIGGSSIYFSSEAAPNIAVKLTQQGLQ
jgi:hypothetical protein